MNFQIHIKFPFQIYSAPREREREREYRTKESGKSPEKLLFPHLHDHNQPISLLHPTYLSHWSKLFLHFLPFFSFSSSSHLGHSGSVSAVNLTFGDALMSVPLEHDYIGLSEAPPSMEGSERPSNGARGGLNMKATELRLGLPGSESPGRGNGVVAEDKAGYPHGVLKSLLVVSGAKRGFSDAIDGGSGKWVFSGSGGSEAELCKGGNLFSPRGVNGAGKSGLGGGSDCANQNTGLGGPVLKDGVVPQSPKPLQEKKSQLSAPAAK